MGGLRAQAQSLASEFGLDRMPQSVEQIVRQVEELTHQGMEPGAYSVTLEQYQEVAMDLITGLVSVLADNGVCLHRPYVEQSRCGQCGEWLP